MTTILGVAALLLEDDQLPSSSARRSRRFTRVEHAIAVPEDVPDPAEVGGGHLEVEPAPLDLRACVEDALDLEDLHADEGLRLTHASEPGGPSGWTATGTGSGRCSSTWCRTRSSSPTRAP
jgi:hypothetical protein